MITRRAMRVIWDVCSVMLFYPSLGVYLWEPIKSYLVCGATRTDDFPQLFMPFASFRPVKIAFENFGFPLVVKKSMVSLLGLLSTVYTMLTVSVAHTTFRVRREISRKVCPVGRLS